MVFLEPNVANNNAMAKFEDWMDDYKDDLSKMLRTGPDFVCVPEFGLPLGLVATDASASEKNWRLTSNKSEDRNWKTVRDSLLPEHGPFVCLGSHHRQYRSYDNDKSEPNIRGNIAPVFPNSLSPKMSLHDVVRAKSESLKHAAGWPDSIEVKFDPPTVANAAGTQPISLRITDKDGEVQTVHEVGQVEYLRNGRKISRQIYEHALNYFDFVERIDHRDKSPVYCTKKSPAKKIGEYLDIVGLWELDVFVTPKGVAAILICFDAFEPTIFMSMVRLVLAANGRRSRFAHQAPDVIFVPSYNRSKKLIDMCKLLSQETHTIVIYLCSAESRHPNYKVFAYGYDCEEFANDLRRENERARRKGKPQEANDNVAEPEFFSSEALDEDNHSRVISLSRRLLITAQRASKAFLMRGQRAKFLEPRTRLGSGPLK